MENAVALVKIFAETVSEKDPPQNGDYIEDGILYCGKCRTAKRRRLKFHGEEIIVPVMCECAARADEEQRRQSETTQANARIAQLRRLSMMDGSLKECSFDGVDRNGENSRSLKICERYAEKFPQMLRENRGLLLFGSVGTGKTFAAACIANALMGRGFSAVMVSLAIVATTITFVAIKILNKDLTNDIYFEERPTLPTPESFFGNYIDKKESTINGVVVTLYTYNVINVAEYIDNSDGYQEQDNIFYDELVDYSELLFSKGFYIENAESESHPYFYAIYENGELAGAFETDFSHGSIILYFYVVEA